MDDQSEYAHLFPIIIEVEQGNSYQWCSCGTSKNQPFCDKDDCGDKSILFVANVTEEVVFCQCKQTKRPPLCDGSHAKLMLEAVNSRKLK